MRPLPRPRFFASSLISVAVGVALIAVLAGCPAPVLPPASVVTTVNSSVRVPADVERLAVLYQKTSNRELNAIYARLEGAAFQLKAQRPSLRIVDRSELQTILAEQRFQVSGPVSDETAIRVGQLLGVDSILLYRVESPTLRDRALAAFQGQLPPVIVTSKIVRVESAEVVFHNVVTALVVKSAETESFFSVESSVKAAMDRGIAHTIADLQHAFR